MANEDNRAHGADRAPPSTPKGADVVRLEDFARVQRPLTRAAGLAADARMNAEAGVADDPKRDARQDDEAMQNEAPR